MDMISNLEDIIGTLLQGTEKNSKNCSWILYREDNGQMILQEHSQHLCSLLGLRQEQWSATIFRGQNLLSFIPWFARERFVSEHHGLIARNDPIVTAVPFVKNSGEISDIECHVILVSEADGKREYAALCEDIEDKKIASLRKTTEQLISVFRWVYDEIGVLNFAKNFYVNVSNSPETLPMDKLQGNLSDIIDMLKNNLWSSEEKKIWAQTIERIKNKTMSAELPGYPSFIRFFNYKLNSPVLYKVRIVPIEDNIYLMLMRRMTSQNDIGANNDKDRLLNTTENSIAEKEAQTNCAQVVSIRTFGYFDVFVNGQAVLFSSAKAKELLAVLVDRRGGYVSSRDAISLLWEDEPADTLTLARYRKVAMRLRQTLEEYGIAHIIQNKGANRRINPDAVECDLFRYLSSDPAYLPLFNGYYMSNYSWGEETLALLQNN